MAKKVITLEEEMNRYNNKHSNSDIKLKVNKEPLSKKVLPKKKSRSEGKNR